MHMKWRDFGSKSHRVFTVWTGSDLRIDSWVGLRIVSVSGLQWTRIRVGSESLLPGMDRAIGSKSLHTQPYTYIHTQRGEGN